LGKVGGPLMDIFEEMEIIVWIPAFAGMTQETVNV